jgi:histone H3/H4
MRSKEFPTAPLERIAKKASKKRIAKGAVKIIKSYILDDAEERAREIAELCRHAGRKTVLKEDVEFVTKRQLPI